MRKKADIVYHTLLNISTSAWAWVLVLIRNNERLGLGWNQPTTTLPNVEAY